MDGRSALQDLKAAEGTPACRPKELFKSADVGRLCMILGCWFPLARSVETIHSVDRRYALLLRNQTLNPTIPTTVKTLDLSDLW